jgi:hypothetical protein
MMQHALLEVYPVSGVSTSTFYFFHIAVTGKIRYPFEVNFSRVNLRDNCKIKQVSLEIILILSDLLHSILNGKNLLSCIVASDSIGIIHDHTQIPYRRRYSTPRRNADADAHDHAARIRQSRYKQ